MLAIDRAALEVAEAIVVEADSDEYSPALRRWLTKNSDTLAQMITLAYSPLVDAAAKISEGDASDEALNRIVEAYYVVVGDGAIEEDEIYH